MHAVLITAYKDFPSLLRLVRRLDRDFFKTYIHIDKRRRLSRSDRDELSRLGAMIVSSRVVRWGSIGHLRAILDLMRLAITNGGTDYIHIISGQDYPLVGSETFRTRCDGRIFMNFEAVAESSEYIQDRYWLRNYFYFLQTGSRVVNQLARVLDPPSRWLQKRLGFRRTSFGPFSTIHKGMVWMSFPASAASELLKDPEATDFLDAIGTAYVPEEIFFQTYFLNSPMRGSIVNDDLRYTDWRKRNGSIPAFLDESDLEPLLRSKALFARKVSSDISSDLLDEIDTARFREEKLRKEP
jgi:hypothetical protein